MALFSRRACTSWRYVPDAGHNDHLPGECVKCWRACSNVITREQWADGVRRCADCVESLVHCPMVQVRRALIAEQNVPEDVLRVLVTDANGPISMKARRLLDELVAARTPKAQEPFGAVRVELPESPRRAHRQQALMAAAAPSTPRAAIAAPRQSVWDR